MRKQVTAYTLHPDLIEKIAQAATEKNISRSMLVSTVLEEYLKEQSAKKEVKPEQA